ncbi:serine hydrolase domain-containing protein [Microbacterium sp. ASV49]|uniref:Beta-lactamase n=1 Tax=Microbacterium candidum TaxID=3041922 RepID=A0ABT7N105_9MICO|nr:serine hydrolase domain-containing protein [Microbacterium sp. ASV49]MDL9980384.1 serine hydrolase domain-containing protein [Microbacterium sp. ASV49]
MTDAASALEAAVGIAERWAVPGGVVAVSDTRGLIAERAFGVSDVEASGPVRPDHLFEIGSISKVATAIAVLQLVDEGMLRLDQPVRDVLPWVPPAFGDERLTVAHLLSHCGGLVASIDAVPDETGQLAGFVGDPAVPGGRFHYSNVGFLLLGRIVAALSGVPFPEHVRRRVLEPTGMADSVAAVIHDDYGRLARGSQRLHDDRPWLPGDALIRAPWLEVAGADGNIAATAADLARFGRTLLNGGHADDGTRILSASAFAAMTAPTAPGGEDVVDLPGIPSPDSSRYGLGINVEQGPGGTVLTHGGGMVGYASFLLIDSGGGLVTAVVTNADGDAPVAEAMARTTASALRGVPVEAVPDPAIWDTVASPATAGRTGDFASVDGSRRISVHTRGDRLELETDGETAPLLWTWSGRAATRHPSLRRHHLGYEDGAWTWGPLVLRPAGAPAPAPIRLSPEHRAHCGHYRGYSPWFTNFRVVDREGALVLLATGGVEAPTEDVTLIPLGDGRFRLGQGEPETIAFGPPVDGGSPWAERDGCRYSRAFTP